MAGKTPERGVVDAPAGRQGVGMSDPVWQDDKTTLGEIKTRIRDFVAARDWQQFHAPKNLSMALAAEAGELLEHFLWCGREDSRRQVDEPASRVRIEEELADVVIYALAFANATGIDLASAMERKIALNAQKYPVEKARGRADKYTELRHDPT